MNTLEKVEALREKANISYEEAKAVLDEANEDLLDAIVILEREGKILRPETEVVAFIDEAEDDTSEKSADNITEEKSKKEKSHCDRKVSKTMKKIIDVLKNNSLHIVRKNEVLFTLPAWAFALLLLFTWKWLVPVMIISLFFEVRYSVQGKDDMTAANEFFEKAGNVAEEVAGEFRG